MLIGILALLVLGLIGFLSVSRLYINILWFDSLGFSQLFWKPIIAKWILAGAAFIVSVLFLSLVWGTMKVESERIPVKVVKTLGIVVASFILSVWLKDHWYDFLLYLNHTSFGLSDPVFHRDVSWYVFTYPVINLLNSWSVALMIFGIAGAVILSQMDWNKELPVGRLSIMGSLVLFLFVMRLYLSNAALVYSSRGTAFGAGYTDVHVQIPVNYLYMAILVVLAIYLAINAFRKNIRAVLGSATLAVVLWIGIVGLFPHIFQKLIVAPNELAKELPYIKNTIHMTREGYGLADIEEEPFNVEELTPETLNSKPDIVSNLRLVDWRPVKAVYQQLQELRPYYAFEDLDVDRYVIDGAEKQVIISIRELDQSKLPDTAKTWINQRLKYTHGYGFVMSPVSEMTSDGQPTFIVKDFPPKGLKVTEPRIYVGELSNDYAFVKTTTPEFDYPRGDLNRYNKYDGKDGIEIGTGLRKLAFAWNYGFTKVLLSSYIKPDSRILINRRVIDRIQTLMPFIEWDSDICPVFANGRIYWFVEGFTTSSRFPFSEPLYRLTQGGTNVNYIRNSVKAVVDAYDGTVSFYMDKKDPIIRSFAKSFPVFKDFSDIPAELKSHMRYSETLFKIQSLVFQSYHMTDPQVFFNKEDQWNIPQEVFEQASTSQTPMDPYFVMNRLKGNRHTEFLLMRPFTPVSKENMVAWMAARSDAGSYGKLVLYKFSKDKLIYGPMQVEAKIDQDTELSKSLTLWNQQSSQVIRGNTLAYPIGSSILYIQPIYLQAEQGKIPELKKIVTFADGRLGIGDNFQEAIGNLFGEENINVTPGPVKMPDMAINGSQAQIIGEALQRLENAQRFAGSGRWSDFGNELDRLSQDLKRLQEGIDKD